MPHWFALPNLPTNIESSALPPWLDTPGLRRYERSALAALWRRDMLAGGWVQRLQRAPSQLVNFINDFYTLPGFHHLVRHAYGGTYRRALALLAIRVVERLAGRDPDLRRRATIEETLSVLPTGDLLLAPELVHNGLRFRFFPWNRVTDRALVRLLQQSAALHPQPANLRWVFAGNAARRREIIRSMRRILDRSPARWRDNPDMRRWVNDLDRIVRVA